MLKKKEKLEQMRELGRGGLSKGLHFLQQRAAAASAALENGEGAAAAPAAADGSKMSYEELLALSMKLTRQNKLMKTQFQKTQTRLKAAAVSDADAALLKGFLAEMGVDMEACRREGEEGPSIDEKELRERFKVAQEMQKPAVETTDLLGLQEVALGGSELDEAMKQVERMREQMRLEAEQTRELERRLEEREAQQQSLRERLETEKQGLVQRLQLLSQEKQEEGDTEVEKRVKELMDKLEGEKHRREQEAQEAERLRAAFEQEREALEAKLQQAEGATGVEEQVAAALQAQQAELEAAKTESLRLQEQLKTLQEEAPAPDTSVEAAEDSDALRTEVARLQEALQAQESESETLRQAVETLKQQPRSTEPSASSDTQAADADLMQELERVKLEAAEHVHELQALRKKLSAADEKLQKDKSEREATQSLVEALKEDTSRLADQVAQYEHKQEAAEKELAALADAKRELEEQQEKDRESRAAMEKQLVEERAYWTSKLENLITDGDAANTKTETLEAELREKDKQVSKMAASQTAMTEELMELQKQLGGMREDLAMAAEGLEAHATKAETNERRYLQSEKEVAELKKQLEAATTQHHENFEMLRREKESELERIQKERRTLLAEKQELSRQKDALESRCKALERDLAAARKHEDELETNLNEQMAQVGNLSVDLAETKKALSDRMAHATRLQTENMGMAGKLAEQVALIEGALRDAATSKAAQKEMEARVQAAQADVQRMKRSEDRAKQDVEELRDELRKHEEKLEQEREQAHQALQSAVDAEHLSFKREVERLEAESKHKSKLALQAVLEKEKEIARLTTRLNEVEEDVRSGDADNRKILEFAQLQAKREAEAREQAAQMQELSQRLEDAQRELAELRDEKRRHAEELTAMLQNQRRDGVNMEYLKNVVVQYMSFRPGSSQQARLVPVLTTLLQFTAADIKEIKHATRRGNSWTSWGTSDAALNYKPIVIGAGHRHPMAPPSTTAQDGERRSPLGRMASAPAPRVSPPSGSSPMSSRASSFFLPTGGSDEPADPSAESADF